MSSPAVPPPIPLPPGAPVPPSSLPSWPYLAALGIGTAGVLIALLAAGLIAADAVGFIVTVAVVAIARIAS